MSLSVSIARYLLSWLTSHSVYHGGYLTGCGPSRTRPPHSAGHQDSLTAFPSAHPCGRSPVERGALMGMRSELLQPTERILRIVHRLGLARELERAEGVDHHRQLL